ncbi:glycoprotein-N-acetylgalactosamine 3-beta-galactosyltransferase 1-like [Uloborus diversus]|uniref:glycoprotein-N-acetylgalactosamine 3-beta-galactosyltransferase 1-like n=1 Tax=Uloborus diversus TaxID=327109 RepID=UPI002408F386|nr:glycoprotein-N-acetylgalactosamine 3-beta-galactosyltransferase 1-like [Uloborus diversus]
MISAFRNRIFLFLCACCSGILFALVWRKYEQTVHFSLVHNHYTATLRDTNYEKWFQKKNLSRKRMPEELLSFAATDKHKTEESFLYEEIPILCLIFVNTYNGADAVKHTWAKHCNIVTFFGRFVDEKIPVIKVPPVTSFEGFCYAFVHVFHKYNGQYKWVLIADDNTYAIIENLRHYVAPLNSSVPYYLGHPAKDFSSLYNLGSAGIVLSYGSMSLFHSVYNSANDCSSKNAPSWYFDLSLGRILKSFNVHPVDTRDPYLRGRFNPFSVETMLIPGSISVFSSYWRTSAFLTEEGMNCCSDEAITFHGLNPAKLMLMEYVQHHLAAFTNSFEGLGNKPVLNDNSQSENSKTQTEKAQLGEPFVQLLDNHWTKSNKAGKTVKPKKSMVENLWNEIFGS